LEGLLAQRANAWKYRNPTICHSDPERSEVEESAVSWSDIASPTPAAEPSQGKQQIPHDSTVRNDNLWVFDVKPG